MKLSSSFTQKSAPGTGRRVLQLTDGDAFCYPLYYYVPTLTADDRFLIYHRAENDTVQLHRLMLATGESVRLTDATCAESGWYPWDADTGPGVLDHRSVLNQKRNEVIYFSGDDGRDVRCVDVMTLTDQRLFVLPPGRAAIGQNCCTPDGEWFVYIHADAEWNREIRRCGGDFSAYWQMRAQSGLTALCAYNLETGEPRELLWLNSPIHHVVPFGNEHFVICHPLSEYGMLLTDLRGGYYTHLRTPDKDGFRVCHYLCTQAGIAYELYGDTPGIAKKVGLFNPFTRAKAELEVPERFRINHTGWDPEGHVWFYEGNKSQHQLVCLKRYSEVGDDEWIPLTGVWPAYAPPTELGFPQKTHFHPQLVGDRQWILLTAGDPNSQTNHIHLLDVEDVGETHGRPNLMPHAPST